MSFNEPMPENYHQKMWPIWSALAICISLMVGLLFIVPGWNLLAMVPYFLFLGIWVIRSGRRHKRWLRDMDAWNERMLAHYARPFEQRRKAIWS